MRAEWLAKPERGSKVLVQLLTWVTLRLGRGIGRAFLYPICLYFIIFSRGTRHASRRHLNRVLQRSANLKDVFHHYYAFASTIHDRIYLLAGRHRYFDLRVNGVSALDHIIEEKRGCILLGSHLGSFEVLRAYGLFAKKLPISVLLHEESTANLNSVLYGLSPEIRSSVIPLGSPDAVLTIKERLNRGELVGILGDRLFHDEKSISCRFFGEDTLFPEGPLLIAALLKVPVVMFFGLYRGGRRYDMHFELLAEEIVLDRDRRSEHLYPWVQHYVTRVEHYCRMAPYNWFNFYELSREQKRLHAATVSRAGNLRRRHV
jgi:predicted LPLAT superfamily acyltransferase